MDEAQSQQDEPVGKAGAVRRGDVVKIRGYEFYVDRINVSSLVLRPLPVGGETGHRRLMCLVTGQPGVYLAGLDREDGDEE